MLHYTTLALEEIGPPADHPDISSGIFLNLGTGHLLKSQYDEAADYFNRALTLAEESGYQKDVSRITNNLGVLYKRLGRNTSAMRTYHKALKLKERSNDSVGIANTLVNLGDLELMVDSTEDAMTHFYRAEEIYLNLGMMEEMPLLLISKGLAYYQRDEHDRCKELLEAALLEPELKMKQDQKGKVYLALSDIYYQEGNGERALEQLQTGHPAAQASGILQLQNSYDRNFGRVYRQLGRPAEATEYFNRFTDSIYAVLREQRMEDKYNTAGKFEAELREAEIQRQELELKQQRQRQMTLWLVLGALTLLFISIFLLLRSRLKFQKSEALRLESEREAEVRFLKQEAEVAGLRAMIEGQESERKRVAKDLHDGLGGLLATVKARLSTEAPTATSTNQLIDRACTEVRRIAHNMMPQTLALSGLSGSVRDIVAQLNQRGLDTELELIGQPDLRLDQDGQAMLLRILQELTHNVVKHAGAEKLFIQLLDQPNQLLLTVEDDGKGFNRGYVSTAKNGIGLENIDSRVAYLRGHIQYDSSPGHGTTVTLTLPL